MRESIASDVRRFAYRLRDENGDGPVDSLCAYVIADDGHMQASVDCDGVKDAAKARQIVGRLAYRARQSL